MNNIKNKMRTDLNFKLPSYKRTRPYKTYNAQNVGKTNETFDLLQCSHSFFKRRIIHQLYGDLSVYNYRSLWCIDHCLPIVSFNPLDEMEMKECFNWIRPIHTKENKSKRSKFVNRLYLLQEIKAYQFLRLNDPEELNQNFH